MDGAILQEKDSTLAIFSLIIFFLVISVLLVIFFFLSKRKIIQKNLEKKELELIYQKKLLEANLFVQEKERKRIGGEIHDDINSQLSILGLITQSLEKKEISFKEIQEVKSKLLNIITQTNENSRRISHNLYPTILEKFGLLAALEDLIHNYNFSNTIDINLEMQPDLDKLDIKTQLHIYRIFQELISNSIKHGNATKIIFSGTSLKESFTFTYNDNGSGFDLIEYNWKKKGLGLKNIENRIYFLNGNFTITTKPQKGFHFEFTIKNQQA